MKRHKKTIGLGGTFDHFHKGHREFIRFAHSLGTKLTIGITAQHMTRQKQHALHIQSYHERSFEVRRFCQREGIDHTIIKLEDMYGPTLERRGITELAVTDETMMGAQQINDTREAMNLRRLPINVFHRVAAADGDFISSSRIRAGRIDREGRVYADMFHDTLTMDETQRAFFGEIQGELTTTVLEQTPAHVARRVVIGDVTLAQFLEAGWEFDLGIFDGKTLRADASDVDDSIRDQAFLVGNESGTIQPRLAAAIRDTGRRLIFVEGEEDLAVIPAVLLLPLGAEVYYGQPDEGLVQISITEERKTAFREIIEGEVDDS